LENKLNLLATIAQVRPVGSSRDGAGFRERVFRPHSASFNAPVTKLAGGVWEALICTFGLAVISILRWTKLPGQPGE
jgi:hypothetical protein